MVETIFKLMLVVSCFISCIYGFLTIRSHFHPSFFKIAVCGMFAFFLSRLFCFVLTLSSGENSSFTIGALGQATSYIFYIIANRAYVPPEEAERTDKSLCPSALVVATVPCIIMIASAFIDGSLGAFLSEILYIITMGPAAYFAFKSNRNKYSNQFRKQLTPFNTCICIMIYINSFSELSVAMNIETVPGISQCILTLLSLPVVLAMLPLLRKGLLPWEL